MRYLVLLFAIFQLQAQTYRFDTKVTYLVEINKNRYEHVTLLNSENDTYRLDYRIKSGEKSAEVATLSDFVKNEDHLFKSAKAKSSEDEYQFKYDKTRPM